MQHVDICVGQLQLDDLSAPHALEGELCIPAESPPEVILKVKAMQAIWR